MPAPRHLVRLGSLDPVSAAPLADAALTPYHAVTTALPRLVPGTTAVVIGAGGLGQYAVQFLVRLTGASVVAVDVAAGHREAASRLGADLTVDPRRPVADKEILDATGGEGAAGVFDVVGSDETLALATAVLGSRGVLSIVGLGGGTIPVSFLGMPAEASVTTSYWGTRNELAEVVTLAASGDLVIDVHEEDLAAVNSAMEHLRCGHVRGRVVLVP